MIYIYSNKNILDELFVLQNILQINNSFLLSFARQESSIFSAGHFRLAFSHWKTFKLPSLFFFFLFKFNAAIPKKGKGWFKEQGDG